ncbi:unnamed protein product [marine sediment metagenome]|uniref:Uncharacterized protein n=1 Tax=marine sediment metagenome TaxID=412755 RepID=X0WMA7_9ZZZZ
MVFSDVCHVVAPVSMFFEYLTQMVTDGIHFGYIIIDPADCLLQYPGLLSSINSVIQLTKTNIICTSQLRQDVSQEGKPYSTIERWNKQHISNKMFMYSMWLRNVSGGNELYNSKYLDIYEWYRTGNLYAERYVLKFSKKEGNVLL